MRLKLVIAYEGTEFLGWQSQAGGGTVQDALERAFALLQGRRVPVHGAGRTDTGVHALAQCAHVDVEKPGFSPKDWLRALNGNLPEQIRVLRCSRAGDEFHARFSAVGKTYVYRVWNHPILSPFERDRAWHLPTALDIAELRHCARLLEGTHDFKAFAANRGRPDESTIRTVREIRVRKQGPLITLTFTGNGFLYKMVRLLTGSLVRCAQGRASRDWLEHLLHGKDKTSFAAPAAGLYLSKVSYK